MALSKARKTLALTAMAMILFVPPGIAQANVPSITGLSRSAGPTGSAVTITGTALKSTTSVSFNGTPATFDPVSSGRLDTFVPKGATTGPIAVRNPDGGAVSAAFTVQPNIVLVLTDDQRHDELGHMPTVQTTLANKGMTFKNGFVVTSLCCPSRTTILTGEYSHSTGIYKNAPPNGGFGTFTQMGNDRSTAATWLRSAGYRTALVGKYLNGYDPANASYVPPGWDVWNALTLQGADGGGNGTFGYYDYSMSIDGTPRSYGSTNADYSTDVLATDATNFIQSTPRDQPLFLFFAPRAPHAPATPASRDLDSCPNLAPNRPPNYNETTVTDKPAYIQSIPLWSSSHSAREDAFWLRQCQSLVAVDQAVGKIVSALSQAKRLSNTLIMFASDNGLAFGEHRWQGKIVPYEESVRIPVIVRYDPLIGDGGQVNRNFVLNLDFAPTFAAAAGVSAPGAEGRSLLPLLDGSATSWRNDVLVEFADGPAKVPGFCAVRNQRYLYATYSTGEEELYDLGIDPYETLNRAHKAGYDPVRDALYKRTLELCSPPPPGFTP
jgi:N-acetylglucosamine-6-sulfatase